MPQNASFVVCMSRYINFCKLFSLERYYSLRTDQYIIYTTSWMWMSGPIVGLLIMTSLFKPACRNKEIKKREENYSICSWKYSKGYKQKAGVKLQGRERDHKEKKEWKGTESWKGKKKKARVSLYFFFDIMQNKLSFNKPSFETSPPFGIILPFRFSYPNVLLILWGI